MRAFSLLLGGCVLAGSLFLSLPREVGSQSLVQNQPVNIAATSLPTNGVSGNLAASPVSVGVFTASFTNSGAATIYCAIYGTAPTLGTTARVGSQIAVPAGATVPKYLGPTNGVSKNPFISGVFGGCATAYGGSTGVAQSTVDVEITYL